MTDEEPIIIHDVDVSKCKYYYTDFRINKVKCSVDDIYHCESGYLCEGEDCYFKQLARKRQECEALKSESFTREELITIQEKDIDRYRKALGEIEEIVKQTCRKRCTNDCLGTKKHCGYGAIFNIINKAKGGEKCQ